jgi:hypothetical protein
MRRRDRRHGPERDKPDGAGLREVRRAERTRWYRQETVPEEGIEPTPGVNPTGSWGDVHVPNLRIVYSFCQRKV